MPCETQQSKHSRKRAHRTEPARIALIDQTQHHIQLHRGLRRYLLHLIAQRSRRNNRPMSSLESLALTPSCSRFARPAACKTSPAKTDAATADAHGLESRQRPAPASRKIANRFDESCLRAEAVENWSVRRSATSIPRLCVESASSRTCRAAWGTRDKDSSSTRSALDTRTVRQMLRADSFCTSQSLRPMTRRTSRIALHESVACYQTILLLSSDPSFSSGNA